MNCWGIRIYFTKSRFSLNGRLLFIWSYCRDMKKSSLNAGTLNWGFTVAAQLAKKFSEFCGIWRFVTTSISLLVLNHSVT
jgi:hypothetical protein